MIIQEPQDPLVNNFMEEDQGSSNKPFNLDLISRKEDIQVLYPIILCHEKATDFVINLLNDLKVDALRDFYENTRTKNQKRLEMTNYVGMVLIPRLAFIFVAGFWTLGLLNYNFPGFSQMSFDDHKQEMTKFLEMEVRWQSWFIFSLI